MPVLFVKQRVSVFEPPFVGGGLRGNVCDFVFSWSKYSRIFFIGYVVMRKTVITCDVSQSQL